MGYLQPEDEAPLVLQPMFRTKAQEQLGQLGSHVFEH